MKKIHIPYKQTNAYSKLILDFLDKKDDLRPFVRSFFDVNDFETIIEERKQFPAADRNVLAGALLQQYDGLTCSDKTKANIEELKSNNSFTLTTGHQLNLFTGPLYFFYKIIHCIRLSDHLKELHPSYNFVPIFWMNTEDHDFEEVQYFNLFGKRVEWNSQESGAVGLFDTNSLDGVIAELKEILGESENAQSILAILEECFLAGLPYRKAMFAFVNRLFAQYGLVILDQHNAELKKLMLPFIKNELTEHQLYANVIETSDKLKAAGYHQQALPRAINLFYIGTDKQRNRIVYKDEQYLVNDTDLVWSEAEILEELERNPIRFSFNVISRPIYQQSILPNLAYIGGGGELAYWMQLKDAFEALGYFYPSLILRNSVLWMDKGSAKKWNKLGLETSALFGDTELLIKDFVKAQTAEELSLGAEKKQLQELFETIKNKAVHIDASLEKSVLGEMGKTLKSVENLESKILRAEKRKFDTNIQQIRNVNGKLFPSGKLQERYDNFMALWLRHGSTFIDVLYQELDPQNKAFTVLSEGE